MRIKGLCRLLMKGTGCGGKLGLALVGKAMLSKPLIQFSVNGWGCVSSLLSDLMPNYGGGNEDNGSLLQKVPCTFSAPNPVAGHHRPTPPLETPGHSQDSLDQCLVGSLLLSPGSWCTQAFVCAIKSLFPWSL